MGLINVLDPLMVPLGRGESRRKRRRGGRKRGGIGLYVRHLIYASDSVWSCSSPFIGR